MTYEELMAKLRQAPARNQTDVDMYAEQPPGYNEFLDMLDRQCGADFSTRGPDPSGTYCDKLRGHYPATEHEGPDPFGGDGTVCWRGGGSCAGDPLPITDIHYRMKTS